MAQRATIWCSANTIDWTQLDSCLALLVRKSQICMEYGPVTEFGASRLVDIVNRIFKRNELGKIQSPSLSLETLVTTLSLFQSTDPHDRIFALLGLANDTERWPKTQEFSEQEFETASIDETQGDTSRAGPPDQGAQSLQAASAYLEVHETTAIRSRILESNQSIDTVQDGQIHISIDYSKDFSQLCDEFVSFAISKSGSLDIIFQPWAPGGAGSNLSSWICTLDRLAFGVRSKNEWPEAVRVNADPFVSPPGQPRTYSASGKLKVQKGWRIAGGEKGLHVMGVTVDSVDAITSPAWDGNMPTEWLKFGGMSKDTVPEAIWHTLVAGRGPQGTKCPSYYSRAFEATLHGIGESSVVIVDQIQFDEPGSIKSEFWRRAQAVIWDRSSIKTRQGRLGIAPSHAEIGDCICILFGCNVPILLRKDLFGTYQLVGESYIYGIMDGEALDVRDRVIEATWFDINSREVNRRPPPSPPLELGMSLKPASPTATFSRVRKKSLVARKPQPVTVPAQLDIVPKQFRLHWTCSCGYRGNDSFMEYRAGAIDELARRLEVACVVVLVELLGLSGPFLDAIKMFLVLISIFFLNILLDLDRTFRSRSGDQADGSPTGVQVNPSGNHPATDSPKNSPLKTPSSKRAHGPLSSSSQPSGQSSSSGIPLITSSSATPRAPTTSSPVTADYVLLCINDSKLLVTRDDLDLTPVVSD